MAYVSIAGLNIKRSMKEGWLRLGNVNKKEKGKREWIGGLKSIRE